MKKFRIGIVHPEIMLKGGSEAVCLQIIEAIKNDYEITLITNRKIDLGELNRFYNLNLSGKDFRVKLFFLPFALLNLLSQRFNKWKWALLQKFAQKGNYDLLVSTFNEADLGKRGIQYIHFPVKMYERFITKDEGNDYFQKRKSLFWKVYYGIYNRWLLPDEGQIKQNRTICNSQFTRTVFEKTYKAAGEVAYPPTRDFSSFRLPWDERENGFVCIGRISPIKNIIRNLEIIKRVRKIGFDVHLHIIGPTGDSRYAKRIKEYCKKSNFLIYEGKLSYHSLGKMMGQHKYLLHGFDFEHFGIVVAEAISAGCIPFVPDSGGQIEIVDSLPSLCYGNVEDAVNKISSVLQNESFQKEISERLRKNIVNFSREKFSQDIRRIIKEELEKK